MNKQTQNIKEQLKSIYNFFSRYWLLCLAAAIVFIASALLPAWNFVAYGVGKSIMALVTALLIRNIFLTTVDKYIDSGSFRTDFFSSSKEVKVCVAAGAVCVFFIGACICFS